MTLNIEPRFSHGKPWWESVVWTTTNDAEAPIGWSENAVNIVKSKYLKPHETSVRQIISRVVDTITQWGIEQRYFGSDVGEAFTNELGYILVNQMAAFNSPVWFNVGVDEEQPQCSACFVLDVDDNMESILEWYRQEAMIFKYGSGAGINISKLRGKDEPLSGGGKASGPLSFMRAADAIGGIIKSGGKTRRAAKLVVMDMSHPDIQDFIHCKVHEEQKARALEAAGYSGSIDGEAAATVGYQNSNHSVRITNAFMDALHKEGKWQTRYVKSGEVCKEIPARDLLREIAAAIHACGDPGIQFHDTVNRWHTCPESGNIEGSNPCFVGETLVDTSEGFMRIDELAEMYDDMRPLPFVFGFDLNSQLPVLRKINDVWLSKQTHKLVEITTEKGIKIRCTPEHRFLTKTGMYVKAKDLFIGQRLRKIGRWVNHERSDRRCLNHRTTPEHPNGTVFQNRFIWEQINGNIPEGWHIHHVNEDPRDDRLSNLELRKGEDHLSSHSSSSGNGRYITVSDELLAAIWPLFEERSKGRYTIARWNSFVDNYRLRGKLPIANMKHKGGWIQGAPWQTFCERAQRLCDQENDKVANVEHIELDSPIAVYDLDIDEIHNFAVSSPGEHVHSIVVHNCSEYMFLHNTACNLSSIRLTKFWTPVPVNSFDYQAFRHVIEIMIIAQDILIDKASYPTPIIAETSHRFRPLGLGFTDLGALLMQQGIPYASTEAQMAASWISSFMTAVAYETSVRLATGLGSFPEYEKNSKAMLDVIEMHRKQSPGNSNARSVWDRVVTNAWREGVRNAQVTLLAPTGTISFMMDCDTTGIEPEYSLVRQKRLVDGPTLTILNRSIESALQNLSVDPFHIPAILSYIKNTGGVDKCLLLSEAQRKVFECAMPTMPGGPCISSEAHLKMMAAVQPHISGAISKTVNCPCDTTVEQIEQLIVRAWELRLKAVAIYRDGSKASQPLTSGVRMTSVPEPDATPVLEDTKRTEYVLTLQPQRVKLPADCKSDRHRFEFGGLKGYIHTGVDHDGYVREIFVRVAKAGSTLSGLIDALSIVISMALQYGVPLDALVKKLSHVRFEPSGWTDNPEIRTAKSLVDYIFRWLGLKYLSAEDQESRGIVADIWEPTAEGETSIPTTVPTTDAPICTHCGAQMVRAGNCHACRECGSTTGCS